MLMLVPKTFLATSFSLFFFSPFRRKLFCAFEELVACLTGTMCCELRDNAMRWVLGVCVLEERGVFGLVMVIRLPD